MLDALRTALHDHFRKPWPEPERGAMLAKYGYVYSVMLIGVMVAVGLATVCPGDDRAKFWAAVPAVILTGVFVVNAIFKTSHWR